MADMFLLCLLMQGRLCMCMCVCADQLMRAAVELAKQWRQDKAMRFLQAELLVVDASTTLTVSGDPDCTTADMHQTVASACNVDVASHQLCLQLLIATMHWMHWGLH